MVRDELPTRVLLLSAHDESAVVYQAIQDGAAGFLPKESTRADIVAAVLNCARGRDVISPTLAAGLAGEIRRRAEPSGPVLSPREREILNLIATGKTIPASSYDYGYGMKQGRWEPLAGTPTAPRQDRLPLAERVILGHSEQELDRCELNAEGRDYVAAILASVERLGEQIETVLDLSQSEAGLLPLASDKIELLPFTTRIVEERAAALREGGLSLDLRGNRSAGWITGDRRRLARAVGHLIDNAIAASPNGGRIRVEVMRHRRRGHVAGSSVRLRDPQSQNPRRTAQPYFGRPQQVRQNPSCLVRRNRSARRRWACPAPWPPAGRPGSRCRRRP